MFRGFVREGELRRWAPWIGAVALVLLAVSLETSLEAICWDPAAVKAVKIDEAASCFEFWLYRYQTLITGAFAVAAALIALLQLSASREQARSAVDQVALSRAALINTERAFIVLQPFQAEWVKNRETGELIGWNFRAVWKNVGNTPTKNMQNYFTRHYQTGIGPLSINSEFLDFDDNIGHLSLGPDRMSSSRAFFIEKDILAKSRTGEAYIYLWGWADYNDVFDNTDRHRTEFCVEIEVIGDPDVDDCGFAYKQFGPFNGIDDECLRRPRH